MFVSQIDQKPQIWNTDPVHFYLKLLNDWTFYTVHGCNVINATLVVEVEGDKNGLEHSFFFLFRLQFRFLLNFMKEKPRNKHIPVHFRPLLYRKYYKSFVCFGCQQIVGLLLTSKFTNILLFISNVTTWMFSWHSCLLVNKFVWYF